MTILEDAWNWGKEAVGDIAGWASDQLSPDDNKKIPTVQDNWWQYGATPQEATMLRGGMLDRAGQAPAVYGVYAQNFGEQGRQYQNQIGDLGTTADLYTSTMRGQADAMSRAAESGANTGYADQYGIQGQMNDLSGASRGAGASPITGQAASGLLSLGAQPTADTRAAQGAVMAAGGNGSIGPTTQQGLSGLSAAGNAPIGSTTMSGINNLNQFARAPSGSSAAEIQMRQGADTASANAMGLAASARGRGQSGAAMQQALGQQAAIQQDTNAQAAQLRAQEEAVRRGENLQAITSSAQLGTEADIQQQNRALSGAATAAQVGSDAEQQARAQQLAAATAVLQAQGQTDATQIQALQAAAASGDAAARTQLAGLGQAGEQLLAGGQFGQQTYQINDASDLAWMNARMGAAGLQNDVLNSDIATQQGLLSAGFQGNMAGTQASMGAYGLGQQQRDAYMNRYYDTYDNEQALRASAYNNWLNNYTNIQLGNQQADVQGDSAIMGLAGGIAGMAML